MAEFSAFATLALVEVAALQSVMSVLVTLPAVVLVVGSLFGIGHTTGKGRIGVLSLKRNCDLFVLAGFYQFVLLDDQANKLLAVDVSFRISLRIIVVLIFSDIWICKLVPRPQQRHRDLLFEEIVVVHILQTASYNFLLPYVFELRQVLWDVHAFGSLDPAKCADVVHVYKIRSQFMDGMQVCPHLVRSCTTMSVYLLQRSNIFINQHLDK